MVSDMHLVHITAKYVICNFVFYWSLSTDRNTAFCSFTVGENICQLRLMLYIILPLQLLRLAAHIGTNSCKVWGLKT